MRAVVDGTRNALPSLLGTQSHPSTRRSFPWPLWSRMASACEVKSQAPTGCGAPSVPIIPPTIAKSGTNALVRCRVTVISFLLPDAPECLMCADEKFAVRGDDG